MCRTHHDLNASVRGVTTGECVSLTSWRVRGFRCFCLWVLDLVGVCAEGCFCIVSDSAVFAGFLLFWLVRDWLSLLSLVREAHPLLSSGKDSLSSSDSWVAVRPSRSLAGILEVGSLQEPATRLPERNLGIGPEISESDLVLTGLKCQFRNGASREVPVVGRRNFRILPKWCDNQCATTHTPGSNFSFGMEFNETSVLSTVSECRFRIVVT
ncbi:hypothetical protein Taro_005925 [Colocasia esculenta]|uniref:Uncharacterized protein n=1 Tax=Colocasia esculenta TaxID=4460 RepID=A0A843TW47_COLES|nr:hypothetical protein [Colocasia esculenta]